MKIYLEDQLLGALYSLAVGLFLGAVYDAFRLSRLMLGLRPSEQKKFRPLPLVGEVVKQKDRSRIFSYLVTFFGDILYFVAATAVYVVFVYHAANGDNRWFYSVGAIVGFVTYFFTVGKLVMRFGCFVRFVLCAAFAYVRFFVLFPFRMVIEHVISPLKSKIIVKIFEKRTKNAKKALAHSLSFVYNINEK